MQQEDNLWVSTVADDYWLHDSTGSRRGVVPVFLYDQPLHWTSDALAWDGRFLWGHLPGNEQGPGGSLVVSTLLGFDPSGTVRRQYRIPRRVSGLAWDGARLWMSPINPTGFFHYDTTGAVLDSIGVETPELTAIDHDGGAFWGIGWFLPLLYRIDTSGRIQAVYDLPHPVGALPAGMAVNATGIWYAYTDPFLLEATLYHIEGPGP